MEKLKRFFYLANELGLVEGGYYIDGIPCGESDKVDEFYLLEDILDYPNPQKIDKKYK